MNYGMQGKVAMVTGAGLGTGKAVSQLLARQGVKVVLAEIKEAAGKDAEAVIREAGGEATYIHCDVFSEEDVKNAVQFTLATYGALDYAINIVGTSLDFTPIADVSTEHWEKMFAINVRGMYFCMKYQLPVMVEAGKGSIVNMASLGGLVGQRNQGAYNASKFAVVGLTKAAALDYAKKGIRINCVCPGPILSDGMKAALQADPHFGDQYLVDVPIGRFFETEEIAEPFAWLCSDAASAITGIALPVDGGMSAD